MPRILRRRATETLTAVEMDPGDTLKFTLRSGEVRTVVLLDTAAAILERVEPGGVVYQFTCRLRIDGRPMTLLRYVCSQECFYEPYVINGMRVWFDAVSDIFRLIPMRDMEAERIPHRRARFAFQDATLRICPQKMKPWYRNDRNFIDVGDCYNGDDCWLGPYLGEACHGGLDINHPKGEELWAPIDFDDQWLFNSVSAGHDNNRWRGVRRWPNGEVWSLQTHHVIRLLVPQHRAIKAGTAYAAAAGVRVGSHEHSHFVFTVAPKAGGPEIQLDPWILFWRIFEDDTDRGRAVRAAMAPPGPARAGRPVRFTAKGCRRGPGGGRLGCYWTFGDGCFCDRPRPTHTFLAPGVYPVTLVVDDGANRAARTCHLTVGGRRQRCPGLALAAPAEPSFHRRPVEAMDVYGRAVRFLPHTLGFVARRTRPMPAAKTVMLTNTGGGTLPQASRPKVTYDGRGGWLTVRSSGEGNDQALTVTADAAGVGPGTYAAVVSVDCPGAANSPQRCRVELTVPKAGPSRAAVVDDRDEGFCCTPYFWVGHRFCRCTRRGFGGRYLTNGGRAEPGRFARFTPDLAAGRYEVRLSDETPFAPGTRFSVRVRHARGEGAVRVSPARSRRIGVFDFDEGADGFVEVLAEGADGPVAADAVVFEPAGRRRRSR